MATQKKRSTSRSTKPNTRAPLSSERATKQSVAPDANNIKTLYVIFGVLVVGLVILIVWFGYILMNPAEEDSNNNVNANSSVVTNANNSNANTNSATTNTNKNDNTNVNNNDNTNSADDEDDENLEDDEDKDDEEDDKDGLVEPDNEDTTDEDDEDSASDGEDGEKITLYFSDPSGSCGDTVKVTRTVELGDDVYGETILTMMRGPEGDEKGEDGIPSTVGLRRVQYTADGPLVLVTEAFDDLDSCTQETITTQFLQTANVMFDLPANSGGEVRSGTVDELDLQTEGDDSTENVTTNSNSNTNSSE